MVCTVLPISAWHYFHSHLKRNKDGDQRLMKKGRGRLIHISDFIEEENGRLIVRNQQGIVVKDARCHHC
jgi:hypothetical protein